MVLLNITKENFEEQVLNSTEPVLLDFWAPWCAPCKIFSPTFEEAAEETPDVKFGKINVDDEQELARHFKVMSIPTLVLVKDGEIADSAVGMKDKDGIKEMLNICQANAINDGISLNKSD